MTVKFYSFSKRPNSTAQPAANSELLTLSSVELKEECNFITPVLKLKALTSGATFVPGMYNYVYIALWQRYYFIQDWTYINGLWEVRLIMDVLASHKTVIGSTNAYILRSASQYNGNILDTFYPASVVKSISKQSVSSEIYHTTLPAGCYVVGIINNSSANLNVGAINYYALNTSKFNSLLQYLFSSNIYNNSNITEMGEGLYKSLFNPFQYIVSCMWFPFDSSTFGQTSSEHMKVGYWDADIYGVPVTNIVLPMNFKTDSPISAHPLAATRGNYLNYAPYTTLTLFYPPFGEIPIDTTFNQYAPNTYLWGKLYIDAITGEASCYISLTNGNTTQTADPDRYMTMRTARIGVPIQLAQVMSDYVSSLSSGLSAIGDLASINIGGIFKNIESAVKSAMPKVSTSGANGSFIEIIEPPYLICEYASLASENVTEFGRPLCESRTINTLSGYIQCGEADHAFAGTDYERNTINEYMRSGFFYE